MKQLRRILISLVVAATGVSLAACGGSEHSAVRVQSGANADATQTTAPLPTPEYDGPITAPAYYGEPGIVLVSPAAGTTPAVSWQTAFEACSTPGQAICDSTEPIHIYLAVATDKQAGQADPDGSIDPVMDNTLVYVISQSGVSCQPAGPAGGTTTPSTYSCTLLDFVDANTGKALYDVESPGVQPPPQAPSSPPSTSPGPLPPTKGSTASNG